MTIIHAISIYPYSGGNAVMHRKPAVTDRIRREKNRRTGEILQAALKVMLEKSYTGATMDDIAAGAGITKPTIYQYFRTKDELFAALIEPLILSLADKLDAIRTAVESDKYKSGKKIIRDVYNVYYGTFESDPDLFRLFVIFQQVGMNAGMSGVAVEKIREIGGKCFIAGQSIVSAAVARGLFRKVDVPHTTDFVWGSFWGIVQVEQNKWGRDGISPYLKPVLKFGENLLIAALVQD